MVGGIKTFNILGSMVIAVGSSPISRFMLEFWQELEDFLGPILGPIVRGFLEPVYRTLEDPLFRRQLLSAIIWTAMIVGGLVFVIYETPGFIGWITGSQASSSQRQTATRPTPRVKRQSEERRSESMTTVEEERERKQAVVEASGVKVQSKLKRQGEDLLLSVIVINGSAHQIDMVVVDIDLPADVNTATGSFRMQRLGTINPGVTEVAEFHLQERGGDLTAIGGHVEFLSASYEISKIALPAPEIVT